MTTSEENAVHGTERRRNFEMTFKAFGGGPSGIMQGATVTERYCATCKAWTMCRDIFAQMQCPTCSTRW